MILLLWLPTLSSRVLRQGLTELTPDFLENQGVPPTPEIGLREPRNSVSFMPIIAKRQQARLRFK